MRLRKAVRFFVRTTLVLTVAAFAVYLFRWPIFGNIVRTKLAEFAAAQLQCDVEFEGLSGSLLYSVEAQGVTLRPRPGAILASAQLRNITVDYGFLGSGEIALRVEGARIVLARKDGPAAPLHHTASDIVATLRTLRFPGFVSARDVEIVLPDHRTLTLDRGTLDHASWSVALRTEGFGTIDVAAVLGAEGELSFDGRATDGPIRWAKVDMGKGEESCTVRISTSFENHPLDWAGTAFFEKGALSRVDGELAVKEGRAQTRVDFLTGRVGADVDAVVSFGEEIKGDLTLIGHVEGALEVPYKEWTVREGTVKTRGARFRNFRIDEADISVGSGSLAEIEFRGSARSGEDRVEAEGRFRWNGQADVEATIRATAADAAPYLELLPETLRLRCKRPHAEGAVVYRDGLFSFDGSIVTGPGALEERTWEVATFKGSFRKDRMEARELHVYGASFAPSIVASGKLEGETVSLRFNAGPDEGEIGGRLQKNGDFEGRIRLEGPLAWLRVFDITLPPELTPVRMAGKLRREKDDTRVLLDLSAGGEILLAPVATIRQTGDDVFIAVAPGTVTMPRRRVDYGAFVLSLTTGKASLENLQLACTEPEMSGRISGSAKWDAKEIHGTFGVDGLQVWETAIEPLVAQVTVDRATRDVLPDLHWGKDDGDYLRVTGRWGREFDLQAALRIGDLRRPIVRRFIPSVELDGSIALDGHLTGTFEHPGMTGTLNLLKVSTAGLPPLSLVVPLRSEDGLLRIWSAAERTPYGAVTLEGSIPLPGIEAPVDLSLKVSTDDLSPLLDRMTKQARRWIPRGALVAEASLRGPPTRLELGGRAEFVASRFKPPVALAEATDLRVVARLDADGVEIETADGALGGGPFWASGRWDFWKPDLPLTLWITGWDVLVVDDPLARIRVKPDAVLTYDRRRGIKVAGRVDVPLAIYNREFSAGTPGRRETARRVVAPHLRLVPAEAGGFLIPGLEGLEAVEIDLKFATTGEFRIENSVVGMLLHAEGRLTGTAGDPALSAVVRSYERRGEVKVGSGTFIRMESAEAILPEEVGHDPTVRFQGRLGAGEGVVQIQVDGPLEGPTLTLKSEPPRPQKELLARLAFGMETGAVSSEAGVATFALYVLDQTREGWPSADRRESFFDKFRPSVIPGETSQQRHVPWELPPAGNLRSTSLRTEYLYNSFFSIVAETNSEGDVGGDLKLRIRF